jgi:hypothetical protein
MAFAEATWSQSAQSGRVLDGGVSSLEGESRHTVDDVGILDLLLNDIK